MALRVIVIMMTIFAISFISACTDSACPAPAQYFLKDIDTHAFDVNYLSLDQEERIVTDTLINQLAFETVAQIEFALNENNTNSFSLMNTAYGCVDNELLNPIQTEWSSLSCNKEIVVRDAALAPPNNCVNPHTNLLEDERVMDLIDFPTNLSLEEAAITRIDNAKLNLIEGDYIFYFKWVTSDGVELTDSIQVYLNF